MKVRTAIQIQIPHAIRIILKQTNKTSKHDYFTMARTKNAAKKSSKGKRGKHPTTHTSSPHPGKSSKGRGGRRKNAPAKGGVKGKGGAKRKA